jgi:hypothetical protein
MYVLKAAGLGPIEFIKAAILVSDYVRRANKLCMYVYVV